MGRRLATSLNTVFTPKDCNAVFNDPACGEMQGGKANSRFKGSSAARQRVNWSPPMGAPPAAAVPSAGTAGVGGIALGEGQFHHQVAVHLGLHHATFVHHGGHGERSTCRGLEGPS